MSAQCKSTKSCFLVVLDGSPYIEQGLLLADFGSRVYVIPTTKQSRLDKVERLIKDISDEADKLLSTVFKKDTTKR